MKNDTSIQAAERARDGAHDAIDDFSDRLIPVVDRAARKAHGLVDKMGIAASDVAEAVLKKKDAMVRVPDRALMQCRDQIRERPFTAVGLAAIAGAAILLVWLRGRAD
ncbi:MAG: hypothetical protein ABIS68_11600 [Casimicrobiaceae bacterium]